MLSKEQGIAYADAMVQAARARRESMAERRTAWACRWYPELKAWPATERAEVLSGVERAYFRRWWPVLAVVAVLFIAVACVLIADFNRPGKHVLPVVGIFPGVLIGGLIVLPIHVVRRAAIRGQLRIIAPTSREGPA